MILNQLLLVTKINSIFCTILISHTPTTTIDASLFPIIAEQKRAFVPIPARMQEFSICFWFKIENEMIMAQKRCMLIMVELRFWKKKK
jgi:hypothetical protein